MKFKKAVALALVVQTLLLNVVSCSETSSNDDKETQKTNANNTSVESSGTESDVSDDEDAENDRTAISDDLPDISFDGKSFRAMVAPNKEYQFFVEESTGDNTNDAIFDRNARIESRFDVKIETVLEDYPYSIIDQYVTSGINVAEVIDHWAYTAYVPISKGHYLDWNTIPYVDQSKPWWNKASNDSATINGKLFCITGDLSISYMRYTYAMFFNMNLMENYGYTSDALYGLVKEGDWTLDKLIEIGSTIYEDKNGDGLENDGDLFGYAYWNYHGTDVWVTAIGEKITEKNADDEFSIALGSEKVYTALEKLNTFIHSTTGAHLYKDESIGRSEFIGGNVGIQNLMVDDCYTYLRDMEDSYGVLPYPKYDVAQEGYYTLAMDQFSVFGLLKTLPAEDYEFVGVMMEALNAETYKTVYPVFFDTALKGKYSADPTTAEMIDLIMDGRSVEFSFQFGVYLENLPYMFRYCIYNNNTNLASTIQKSQKAINKKLKKIYSFYADEE